MNRSYIIGIDEVIDKFLDKNGKLFEKCRNDIKKYNLSKKILYESNLLIEIVASLTKSKEICNFIDRCYSIIINNIIYVLSEKEIKLFESTEDYLFRLVKLLNLPKEFPEIKDLSTVIKFYIDNAYILRKLYNIHTDILIFFYQYNFIEYINKDRIRSYIIQFYNKKIKNMYNIYISGKNLKNIYNIDYIFDIDFDQQIFLKICNEIAFRKFLYEYKIFKNYIETQDETKNQYILKLYDYCSNLSDECDDILKFLKLSNNYSDINKDKMTQHIVKCYDKVIMEIIRGINNKKKNMKMKLKF